MTKGTAARCATTLSLLSLGLLACTPKNEYAPPPPPAVAVASPETEEVTEYAEFVGRVVAQRVVEIRPRVSGNLVSIDYKPGVVLDEKAPMFKIDPVPFDLEVTARDNEVKSAEASLVRAEADTTAAKAQLALAEVGLKKLEKAYATRAVSEIQVLEVRAQRDVARAGVKQAKAAQKLAKEQVGAAKAAHARAKLQRTWADVTAPIRGRAAFRKVEQGEVVNSMTVMTTIVDDEDVFVDFDIPERQVAQLRKRFGAKGGKVSDIVVEVGLPTDEGFPHTGKGEYIAPEVDADTGTLRCRARLKNEKRALYAGSFVRVRMPIAKLQGALLVPRRAVSSDQVGDYLLVVDAEDTVRRRDVKLGFDVGARVVITKGLETKDRVIVDGIQRARPGSKVTVEAAKTESAAKTAAAKTAAKTTGPAKTAKKTG